MKKAIRQLCINLGVTFVTLVALGLFFEFIAFQYVFKASEYPDLATGGSVIKFRPDQNGVFRLRNEISSRFAINGNGWNSSRKEYLVEKSKLRIAIVGDSYLEAFQVDSDASIGEKLEALGRGRFEVYRFGISGAPLSQYLYMLREEILGFKPDIVIFNLVHNDFDESYDFKSGAYTSSFLKLKMDGGRVVGEIPPVPYSSRWYDPIRRSNTWRYLAMRQQVRFQGLRDLFLGRNKPQPKYQANINVDSLENKDARNLAAAEYVFSQAQTLCQQNGAQLVVVMDGVRQLVYQSPEGSYDRKKGALALNDVARSAAEKFGIPFVDLHDSFARHYREHGQRFEFKHDGHWNELGHEVAAKAVYEGLRARSVLPGQ